MRKTVSDSSLAALAISAGLFVAAVYWLATGVGFFGLLCAFIAIGLVGVGVYYRDRAPATMDERTTMFTRNAA